MMAGIITLMIVDIWAAIVHAPKEVAEGILFALVVLASLVFSFVWESES